MDMLGDDDGSDSVSDAASESEGEDDDSVAGAVSSTTTFYPDIRTELVEFGKFNAELGEVQRDTCQRIAFNTEKHLIAEGFKMSQGDEIIRAFICALFPLANAMLEQLKHHFTRQTRRPLHLGLVVQFLLELLKKLRYNLTPTESFDDADSDSEAPNVRDGISREDFAVLWDLLESATTKIPNNTGRLFEPLHKSDNVLEAMIEASTEFTRSLLHGVKRVNVVIDDLMTAAQNKQPMSDIGLSVKRNDKDGSGVGCSADVVMACPRAQLIIGFSYFDRASKDKNMKTWEKLLKAVQEVESAGTKTVTTLDRGYEATTLAFHKAGLDTISTSVKASPLHPNNVFAWEVRRRFKENVVDRYCILSMEKHEGPNLPYCRWAMNHIANRAMIHFCRESSNNIPVPMKTSLVEYNGCYVQVPLSESDRIELTKSYKKKIAESLNNGSNGEAHEEAHDAVVSPEGPSLGSSEAQVTNEELSVETPEAFLREIMDQACILGSFQRTGEWFRHRHAITSTRLRILLTWYRSCWRSFALEGAPLRPSLKILCSRLFRREPSGLGSQLPVISDEAFAAADKHMQFLLDLACSEDPALSNVLKGVAGALRESCAPEELWKALEQLKIPNRPKKPSANAAWSRETIESMRKMLKDHVDQKKDCDLSAMLMKDVLTGFSGNAHTRLGQIAVDAVANALPRLLRQAVFLTESQTPSAAGLVEEPLFHFVSNVVNTGCVAPHQGSHCVTSNDGWFAVKEHPDGHLIAYQLECKTKTTAATVSKAREIEHNRLFIIKSDSSASTLKELARYLTDSAYSLQILHHAASARVNRILVPIVDGLGGVVIRYVAVWFDEAILERHRAMVDMVVECFVPFWKRPTKLDWGGISAERINFNRVLRELTIQENQRVAEKSCIPVVNALYNATKSPIDVLHRRMGSRLTPNAGSYRPLKLTFIDAYFQTARQIAKVFAARSMFFAAVTPEEIDRALAKVGTDRKIDRKILRTFSRDMHYALSPPVTSVVSISSIDEVKKETTFPPSDPNWSTIVMRKRDQAVAGRTARGKNRSSSKRGKTSRPGLSYAATSSFRDPDLSLIQSDVRVVSRAQDRSPKRLQEMRPMLPEMWNGSRRSLPSWPAYASEVQSLPGLALQRAPDDLG